MSVSSVGSSSAYVEWRAYMQSVTSSTTTSSSQSRGDGDADDSASISQQGFAALFQGAQAATTAQGPSQGGGSGLTDSRAAEIGSKIQSRDPSLFKKLDANGDGTLTAQELKDGRAQMRAARAAKIGEQIGQANPALFKALDANGDETLSADELKAGKQLLSGSASATSSGASATTDPNAVGSTNGLASGVQHHHHHHHGGGGNAENQASQQQSSASGAPNGTSASDMLANLLGGSSQSNQAKLQTNSLNDVLQQLFGSQPAV